MYLANPVVTTGRIRSRDDDVLRSCHRLSTAGAFLVALVQPFAYAGDVERVRIELHAAIPGGPGRRMNRDVQRVEMGAAYEAGHGVGVDLEIIEPSKAASISSANDMLGSCWVKDTVNLFEKIYRV